MAYWILNKITGEPSIAGSLPKVVNKTALNKKSLEYWFSQKKEIEYNDEKFRIVKFPEISLRINEISNKELENNYINFLKTFVD